VPGSQDATELLPQQWVAGRYLLGERLGAGGMAEVFRAHDELLGRDVAIKVFGAHIDAHGPDRVRAEMRTLASLNHPALVTVHDAGTDSPAGGPERAFLVMQLVDGPNLAQALAAEPHSAAQVAVLGATVAEALAYVHQRAVVHRDIKPANILLDSAGRPYLADFGIAQTLGQESLTATGLTLGTAPYLSPEQVSGQPVGPASDVYALGLVLLEALTGKREYPGSTAETALARLSRPPEVPAHLPAPWVPLLRAMTRTDPADRPSAAAVAAALQASSKESTQAGADADPQPAPDATRLLTALSPSPDPITGPTTRVPPPRVIPPADRRTSKRTLQLLAAAAAVLLLVVVLALISGRSGSSRPTISPVAPGTPGPARLDPDLSRLRELLS
jgi:serine/threonine protein kinase